MSDDKSEKTLARLNKRIQDGDYYEAHQLYRTIFARHLKTEQYQQAIDIAYQGGVTLNQHQQHSSASDMGLLLLDAYTQGAIPLSDESKKRILDIFKGFRPGEPTKIKFMKAAIRWSAKYGGPKSGDPELRHAFGFSYWQEKNYTSAQDQFLHGTEESAKAMGQMLYDISITEGYKSEQEYFITRVVLQYACLGNLRDAYLSLSQYTSLHFKKDPSLKTSQTTVIPSTHTAPGMSPNHMINSNITFTTSVLPLFNFCFFLIMVLMRNNVELFQILKKRYASALSKDPTFTQYLEKIGQSYFNLAVSNPQMGLFGDMFRSLFAGEDAGGNENPAQGGAGGNPGFPGGNLGNLMNLFGNMPQNPAAARRISTPSNSSSNSSVNSRSNSNTNTNLNSRVASNPELD